MCDVTVVYIIDNFYQASCALFVLQATIAVVEDWETLFVLQATIAVVEDWEALFVLQATIAVVEDWEALFVLQATIAVVEDWEALFTASDDSCGGGLGTRLQLHQVTGGYNELLAVTVIHYCVLWSCMEFGRRFFSYFLASTCVAFLLFTSLCKEKWLCSFGVDVTILLNHSSQAKVCSQLRVLQCGADAFIFSGLYISWHFACLWLGRWNVSIIFCTDPFAEMCWERLLCSYQPV